MTDEQFPIQTGNAAIDSQDTRGWLIGNFIDEKFGLRHTDDVELKWGVQAAGSAREEWVTGENRTAIGILISGTFEMEFRDRPSASTNQVITSCGIQEPTTNGELPVIAYGLQFAGRPFKISSDFAHYGVPE